MHLPTYPPNFLPTLASLHRVHLNGISISGISPTVGLGLLFHPATYNASDPAILTVDQSLVLSAESVELAIKSDPWVRDVVRACCGIGNTDTMSTGGEGEREREDGEERSVEVTADFLDTLGLDEDEDAEGEGGNGNRGKPKQWGRNPRLMIMAFLAVMLARGAVDPTEGDASASAQRRKGLGVGTGGIWSEYIKFLPTVSVPTTWSEEERALLRGTSIDTAVSAKMGVLSHEFHALQYFTSKIPWCAQYLWDPPSLSLRFTLDDWIKLDSWFRSRCLDLPGLGSCMVPFVDMANHGGEDANAYYALKGGDVVLYPIYRKGKGEAAGYEPVLSSSGEDVEVRINYGLEKSPAEQVFSYGFISTPENTSHCSVPLAILPDDPLGPAKEVMLKSAPTLQIAYTELSTTNDGDNDTDRDEEMFDWSSDAIWLLVANAEDGLSFQILQQVDGTQELKLYWRGDTMACGNGKDDDDDGVLINDVKELHDLLLVSPLWDIFHLRAVITAQAAVEGKLALLQDSEALVSTIEGAGLLSSHEGPTGVVGHDMHDGGKEKVREEVVAVVKELRDRERRLYVKAVEWFEEKKDELVQKEVVKRYLAGQLECGGEDDAAVKGEDVPAVQDDQKEEEEDLS